MAKPTFEGNIEKYDKFINEVLKQDLKDLQMTLEHYNNEASDLIQQRHTLKVLTDKQKHPTGFKTQVNLGCNFFMEASVTKTDYVLVNVGLNHYVEFNLSEAQTYLDDKITALEKKSQEVRARAAQVSAHIKLMLYGISELQGCKNAGDT